MNVWYIALVLTCVVYVMGVRCVCVMCLYCMCSMYVMRVECVCQTAKATNAIAGALQMKLQDIALL